MSFHLLFTLRLSTFLINEYVYIYGESIYVSPNEENKSWWHHTQLSHSGVCKAMHLTNELN